MSAMSTQTINPARGEIWLVNFNPQIGAEIEKLRPAVVVSINAIGRLPLRIVVPITAWSPVYVHSPCNGVELKQYHSVKFYCRRICGRIAGFSLNHNRRSEWTKCNRRSVRRSVGKVRSKM